MAGDLIFVGMQTAPFIAAFDDEALGRCMDVSALPGGQPNGTVNAIEMSPDGTMLAVGISSSPFLIVYATATWERLAISGGNPAGIVRDISWSADGTRLALAHSTSPYITVYTVATWAKVSITGGLPPGNGYGVSWSPDGSKLAHQSNNVGGFTVYDTATWTKITLTGGQPAAALGRCRFSPTGAFLAVGSGSGLTVYNVSDWSKVALSGGAAGTSSVDVLAFSPDGAFCAVQYGPSPYLYIYETTGWTFTSPATVPSGIRGLNYSGDGAKLVVSTNTVAQELMVFDTSTWTASVLNNVLGVAIYAPLPSSRATRELTTGLQSIRDASDLPAAGRAVRAYSRTTGALIAQTTSRAPRGRVG